MSPVEIELLFCVATGFDLMEFFSVRDILGTKEDDGQSSYVRLGAMPIVQQTEWVTELFLPITTNHVSAQKYLSKCNAVLLSNK